MRCALPLVGIVLALTAARPSLTPTHASPGPGPGAPFGGDDTGCVPATAATLKCADKAAKTVAALIAAVAKCHGRQADVRFAGSAYDEEGCETAARARFDGVLASLAAAGSRSAARSRSSACGPRASTRRRSRSAAHRNGRAQIPTPPFGDNICPGEVGCHSCAPTPFVVVSVPPVACVSSPRSKRSEFLL